MQRIWIMTLQDIINLGYTSVVVKVSGYQEVGLFGHYQPFRTLRSFDFEINSKFMTLEHETFWINDEETLDYAIEYDEAILYEPDMYARADD